MRNGVPDPAPPARRGPAKRPAGAGRRAKGDRTGEIARDKIVRALEEDILVARIRPGERLDERALAERFQVSRAPVRDAVGRLASLGLIDVRPRSGSYVMSLGAAELFELFEVMSGLEGLCAYHAAQRLEADQQTELRRLAEGCVMSVDVSVEAYVIANSAFHDAVYRGTKNDQLERLTRQSRQRVSAYRNSTFRLPGRLRRSSEEHLAIVDAICSGDCLAAQRLMADHVDIKRGDFAPFISRIQASQPAQPTARTNGGAA